MTEEEILAEAEARANMQNDSPTEEDFQNAEDQVRREVREQLEDDLDRLNGPSPIELIRAVAAAETVEERENAIAKAVAGGVAEKDIRDALVAAVPETITGSITVSMNMIIRDVATVDEALDTFNASLGRYGTEPFYLILRDESGRQWVVHNGQIITGDEDEEDEDDDDGDES